MTNAETKAIGDFLNVVMLDVKRTMDEKDLNSSGKTGDSLFIEENKLIGSGAFYFLEHGRAPGKMPPISAMEDTIKNRGLTGYSPWAMAKSIAENGTRIYRNKSLGFSVGEIATKYVPEMLNEIATASQIRIVERLNEKYI